MEKLSLSEGGTGLFANGRIGLRFRESRKTDRNGWGHRYITKLGSNSIANCWPVSSSGHLIFRLPWITHSSSRSLSHTLSFSTSFRFLHPSFFPKLTPKILFLFHDIPLSFIIFHLPWFQLFNGRLLASTLFFIFSTFSSCISPPLIISRTARTTR